MIGTWLIKLLLGIALLGVVAFDVGSPLITKAQVDETAHQAADGAARELADSEDVEAARAVAEQVVATNDGMFLAEFTAEPGGGVTVTVTKQADGLVLDRFNQTRGWYDVSVTAQSTRPTR